MNRLKIRIELEKLEKTAYILKCMAHPMRLGIIDLLEQNERLTVSQLQEVLQIEQSLLSHHLTNMRDKGILSTQRQGKNVIYYLSDASITNIIACIQSSSAF